MLSIIIPANNEQAYIGACLEALLAQDAGADLPAEGQEAEALGAEGEVGTEVVVSANACTDATVEIARSYIPAFAARGWRLTVLDSPEPGKLPALNRADRVVGDGIRVYLDADVICSPPLIGQLAEVLSGPGARYASGTLQVAPAKSWVTRHFARVWVNLPFMKTNVPGAGLFAVNAQGRARWDSFPAIISDDGFVRLQFTPEERYKVAASYSWPMIEGFRGLVKVRRRQDNGVREIEEKFPEIVGNESKPPLRPGDYLRLFASQPVSFVVYVGVILAVRFGPQDKAAAWTRGR